MTTDQPEPNPTPALIVKRDVRPCGCVETTYGDGAKLVQPCPPCGFEEVARLLHQVGSVMSAVAQSIARATGQAAAASRPGPRRAT